MPRDNSIRKTMVIGSGPIVIGQAAEFDYAGTQACRVLREEGVQVVLVNSNPATIMTDQAMADAIYLEPLNLETVKRIIEHERPDSLLAGLGGQTGLTLAMQLEKEGFLEKMGCRLLGTSAEAIDRAEDRKMFKDTMDEIGQPTIPSEITNDVPGALKIADEIGYPVIIRPAFTLGGAGGGVAYTAEELKTVAKTGLDASPITQVLVEKYIYGWKEIEFEAMRDSAGNAIAVCSMENFDPVGVHTGDSIVAAPALTLSPAEFHMLRRASLDIIGALGIVGGCNCQFALDPHSMKYAVIEVNPRVSRSSALASKATGYPIAKITAKVALGYTLDEIKNDITGVSYACSEPTVDYVVVKFPKWPFDKFVSSSRTLGTQMKATGEVMSIASSFEAAVMKAVRGAEISLDTLNAAPLDDRDVRARLADRDDRRIFTVFEAIKAGLTDAEIHDITKIDPYFLGCLRRLAAYEARLAAEPMSAELYLAGKRLGYPDRAIARLSGCDEKSLPHRAAVYKMVDTCAAELPARTPYFYSTYDEECEARAFVTGERERIIVLGSGPIRIGQGIEFDYSSVHCVWTLKQLGYDVVIINNNPETVSTDYDTADRLYFEPLTPEDVMNVIRVEKPVGVVVAFGGQTAIKLTKFLDECGIKILGTSADGIDTAEDRERFDALLEKFGIRRPQGCGVHNMEEALSAAERLGYPVLLRPSYVIGGQNMMIVHDEAEVRRYMERIIATGIEGNVLVDKYMCGPELEVDVISDGKDVLIPGIMEHIERAGVHSGDSIAVYPPYNLTDKMMQTVVESSEQLALSLGTKGLVNIQYLIYGGELYVIEVNPRASRTVPYISKVTGVPMVDLASRVMCGAPLASLGYGTGLYKTPPYCAVKVPVFSFEKLTDVNSALGPEMKSTGEVLGVGKNIREALYKGLAAAGFRLISPRTAPGIGVLMSVDNHDLPEAVGLAKKLDDLGYRLYATRDTAELIATLGIDVTTVAGVAESDEIFSLLDSGKLACVVYTGALYDATVADYIALHRRALLSGVACLTSLDTAGAFADTIASGYAAHNTELVDIVHLRSRRGRLRFAKMQGSGDDYIFIENFGGEITCPESLCVAMCDRHYGVGALGIVLIEKSAVADVKMRVFNSDGTESQMAGNCIRCLGKYVRDNGIVNRDEITVETAGGIRTLTLHMRGGRVGSATVDMGRAVLNAADIPCTLASGPVVDAPLMVDGEELRVSCVGIGNPHCVTFVERVDGVDIARIGSLIEHHPAFPERVNAEFVRVVNPATIRMRVWERGNGETMACGTGACAAAVAACEKGLCKKGEEITVKTPGGDLLVRYTDEGVTLSGRASLVYTGEMEY